MDSSCWHLCLFLNYYYNNKHSKVPIWKLQDLILGFYEQSYPFQEAYSSDWLTEKKFSCGLGPVHEKIKRLAVPII